MVVHTSKAQKKEVAISPVRSRLSAFASKFFESRSDAKRMAIQAESRVTRRRALKSMAALLGLSVVTACAPAAVLAEPTGKQKQTELPEVDNIEPVTKAILATPENFDRMEDGEYTKTESFVLLPMRVGRGSSITIYLRDDSKKDSLGEQVGHKPSSTASHVAYLEVGLEEGGKLLLIADEQNILPFRLNNNEVEMLDYVPLHLYDFGLKTEKSFIAVIKVNGIPLTFILPSEDGTTFKSGGVFAKLIYGEGSFSKEFAKYTGEDISLVPKASDSSSIAMVTP